MGFVRRGGTFVAATVNVFVAFDLGAQPGVVVLLESRAKARRYETQ